MEKWLKDSHSSHDNKLNAIQKLVVVNTENFMCEKINLEFLKTFSQ